jgi:hypothetical protein
VALRKSKRAGVTQTTVDGAKAEAEKAGMTLNAFLREWCFRGSQGLKAEWLGPSVVGRGSASAANSGGVRMEVL